MPTNRFQFSDDFVLNNGNVGIGSSVPQDKLDVVDGSVRGEHLKVTGVSSFTSYEGFLNSNQNITESISLTAGTSGSLSGEIIVGTGVTVTVQPIGLGTTTVGVGTTTAANGTITNAVSTTSTVVSGQGSVDSLKVYNTFTVPVGGTADRPPKPTPGQLFFNRDFATMEFWDGDRWRQVDNTTQRGRGVFGGGRLAPTNFSTIQYINISTTGNTIDFGNLTAGKFRGSGCSSSIRGLFGGAAPSSGIEYITTASGGNGISFGNLSADRITTASCSSSTRGLWAGGYSPENNVIDYVEISTLGNALDFGDLSDRGDGHGGQRLQVSSCASSTRGLFGGGTDESPAPIIEYSIIDYVTIASKGNAVGGGDLTSKCTQGSACSNSTRGIFAEVRTSINSVTTNLLSYVTISTLGNAVRFGELTQVRFGTTSTASQTRGVFAGGATPTNVNTIDYITISTTGNAIDFGDLSSICFGVMSLSDSHGGLGGF